MLPQTIGTADYPEPANEAGKRVAKHNRRTLRSLYDDQKEGPFYLNFQLRRCRSWARTARKYEKNPWDFARAWRYLDTHPIFYKFRDADDETVPLVDVLQERNLEKENGFNRIDLRVSRWCVHGHNCDERNSVRNCKHPKRAVVWAEAGEWSWPADKDPEHPYEPRSGIHAFHDYRLDVYGDTYESCVLQLAYQVWRLYGNDRRACQENRRPAKMDSSRG